MIKIKDCSTAKELREWLETVPDDTVILVSETNSKKRAMARVYLYGYFVEDGCYFDAQYSKSSAVTIL